MDKSLNFIEYKFIALTYYSVQVYSPKKNFLRKLERCKYHLLKNIRCVSNNFK